MALEIPQSGTLQATALQAIPVPTLAKARAVAAVAAYLSMLRALPETRLAIVGDGFGVWVVPDRVKFIYARLGASDGDVIEARVLSVLNPQYGNTVLVRKELPGGLGGYVVLDWLGAETPPIVNCCYPPPANLVAWWTADNTAADFYGFSDGTLMNGATYAAGMVDDAFSLERANDDHVFIGDTDETRLAGSLTIDAWVFPTSVPDEDTLVPAESWSQPYAIVTKWGQDDTTDSYGMWLHSPDGIEIRLLGGLGHFGSPDAGFTGFGTIPVNEWSFVAMTYDAATDDNYLYINGAQVSHRIQAGGTTSSNLNVLIGREDSPLPRNFNGKIDEVEIAERAFTAEEIMAIYMAGAFGKCKE